MERIITLIIEAIKDILKFWLGDPRIRTAKFIILAAIPLIATPWWLPFLQLFVSHYLDFDLSFLENANTEISYSGWFLLGIGIVFYIYLDRTRNPKPTTVNSTPTGSGENQVNSQDILPVNQFSYRTSRLKKVVRFDENCKGTMTLSWIELRAPNDLVNFEIPVAYIARGTTAPFFGEPTVKEMEGSSLPVRRDSFNSFPVPNEKNVTIMRGTVLLNGSLGQNSVSFSWEQPFQNIYLMTREEVEDAFINKNWKQLTEGNVVRCPSDYLEIEVIFPASFENLLPPPQPVVFIGQNNDVDQSETERCRSFFTFLGTHARLEVPKPIVDRIYAISWMPPAGE